MRRPSGRQTVARKIMLDASQRAMETGEHTISLRCRSRSDAFNIRQSCYSYQRTWAHQVEQQAALDGKDPYTVLHETMLKASWPSASIRYEFMEGQHWLVIEFKRIPTDPDWDDLIRERMVAGPPPRSGEHLNSDEIYDLIKAEVKP
jgi:hypothetical protein